MTLIPAWACNGGFVIHADSEENCGDFRRSVQKIVPKDMGQLRVVIAGAGIGDLIEGFIDRLKERLDQDHTADIRDVKRIMEQRLPDFYSNDVANYPCTDAEKLHKFIVGAYSPASKAFAVWASSHTRLIPVTSYELAGVEDKIYDYLAQRLYRPDMTFSQAILAGLYLLTVAEATSSYVGGPYRVAVVSARGIEMEDEPRVRAITDRIIAYERQVNALFLACADTSIAVPDFEDLVDDFKRTASALHRDHIDQQVARTSFEEMISDSPLKAVPGVIGFGLHGVQAEHDRQKLAEARRTFRQVREWHEAAQNNPNLVNAGDVRVIGCTTPQCGRVFFGKLTRAEGADPILEGTCPKCGNEYRLQSSDLT